HGIGGSLGGFKKTPLGKAAQLAIKDIVNYVAYEIPAESSAQLGADYEICPQCSEEMDKGSKFCTNCGMQVTDIQCLDCGKKLSAGTNFCPGCGSKVGK
ncbi:zinc-ribbon domain-containing protein, partial [Candidatus Omnitrophota bacterium]